MPPPFPELPILNPDPPGNGSAGKLSFPILPIVSEGTPRKTQVEKYGSMLYLGLGGLVAVLTLVGWFAYQVSTMREVWSAIYVLHDSRRPAVDRVAAAEFLSRDPRLNQRQRYEMVETQRGLPLAARYLLAESLTAEAAQADPRAYALAVARSQGWPDWLRHLLLRPMAYAAASGTTFPTEALQELSNSPDATVVAWAAFLRTVQGDPAARVVLEHASEQTEIARGKRVPSILARQARCLLAASQAEGAARLASLDEATRELRIEHADIVGIAPGKTD